MEAIKILMGIPTPRDNVDGVSNNTYGLPIDVLTVKYFKEYVAYQIIRDYFLAHKEYTHLLIKGDDVIVTKKHYEQLLMDVI